MLQHLQPMDGSQPCLLQRRPALWRLAGASSLQRQWQMALAYKRDAHA